MHDVADVDDQGVADGRDEMPPAIAQDLQSRLFILQKERQGSCVGMLANAEIRRGGHTTKADWITVQPQEAGVSLIEAF